MPPPIERYKPGSVRRVRLQNFLTYSDVEFYPGPRLNVVVGPNGTGKSTLLCAICLGLGGQPNLLGRADDARIFVMHEKDKAMIEIELVPHHDSKHPAAARCGDFPPPHVLRRVIDRNLGAENGRGAGASTFFINDRKTNIKTVRQLVTEVYHIQIDNLCTFLPQDKVGSFSGFNAQGLLVETEKALMMKWYDTHQRLIKIEEELCRESNTVETIGDKLQTLQAENEKLEREKEMMEERETCKKRLVLYKQKKAWLLFDDARQRAVELKELKQKCATALKKARAELRPLEDRCAEVEDKCQRIQSKFQSLDKEMKATKKEYTKQMSKADKFQDDIDGEIQSINSIDAMQRKAERLVQTLEAKLQQLTEQMEEYPAREELVNSRDEASKALRALKQRMDRSKRERDSLMNQANDLKEKAATAEQKLARMNDDKARRKDRLFGQLPRLAEVHAWVDQNRKMFRRPVWGPIALEVTTKSANASAYLEAHVANSMLKAYVVECEEDYNLLYREVRQKQDLPINVHKVPQGKLDSIRRMYSDEKINMLKRDHGVIGYLDEAFTAPDPVMQALRTSASVHKVLIGTEKTQESIDRHALLDLLAMQEEGKRGGRMNCCIFSSTGNKSYKYTSMVSRYSGKSAVRVDDISKARLLAAGIPTEQKDALKEELRSLQGQYKDLQPDIASAQEEYDGWTKQSQDAHQKTKEARAILSDFENLRVKVNTAQKKLNDAKNAASKDNVAEKENLVKQLKKHVGNSMNSLEIAASKHEALMAATSTLAGAKMTEDCLSASARKLQDKLAERKELSVELDLQAKDIAADFTEAKRTLKRLKEEAQRIAPMTDANGNDLPLKGELEKLPETLDEIEAAVEDANIKINSISDNPEVLRLYEQRKKEIEVTKREMEEFSEAQNAKKAELDATFSPWEAALVNTTKKVNKLFSGRKMDQQRRPWGHPLPKREQRWRSTLIGKYMQELGCAGEVRVVPGTEVNGVEDDGGNRLYFKDWGIEIKVRFREKTSLQVLSAQVQSGGERSVSTIMYLMALQELMAAPFRCVDEINQGLDERNERLVFKRIVQNSTRPPEKESEMHSHCGQYFLITPKLLPNLTDMEHEDVTILFIFNGPFNFPHYADWKTDEFIASRKRALSEEANIDGTSGQSDVEKENAENRCVGEEATVPRKRGGKKKRRG